MCNSNIVSAPGGIGRHKASKKTLEQILAILQHTMSLCNQILTIRCLSKTGFDRNSLVQGQAGRYAGWSVLSCFRQFSCKLPPCFLSAQLAHTHAIAQPKPLLVELFHCGRAPFTVSTPLLPASAHLKSTFCDFHAVKRSPGGPLLNQFFVPENKMLRVHNRDTDTQNVLENDVGRPCRSLTIRLVCTSVLWSL